MLEIIYIVSVIVFLIRTLMFLYGALHHNWRKISIFKSIELKPKVSIIIPCRNEENNIENCIRSVFANKYPINKFEIIAVNDRSTDNTEIILNTLKLEIPNLFIVNINNENRKENLRGKPGALQSGIDQCSGELILMTDADCLVSNLWIETIVNEFNNPEVGLVASFTGVKPIGIFSKYQAVEWVYMHIMACGGIGLKQPLGCWGNNLSVRKSVFDEIGGYDKIKFSITEDLALLKEVFNRNYKLRYILRPESKVETSACSTLREFIRQHHRWVIGGKALGWRAVVFVMTTVAIWLGIFLSIITSSWSSLIIILLIRILCDFLLTSMAALKLKIKNLVWWIIPSIPIIILMELIAPFMLLSSNVEWKEQKFKSKKS